MFNEGDVYKVNGEEWRDHNGYRWLWSAAEERWISENKYVSPVKEEVVTEQPVKRGRGRPRKDGQPNKSSVAAAAPIKVTDVQDATKDALMELFLLGAREKITDSISKAAADGVNDVVAYLDAVREEIIMHESKKLVLVSPMGTKELIGTRHMRFEQLLTVVGAGLSAMLVGPAGSGKTYASEQTAEALNLPFYSISVGAQTSKSDLFGYMDGGGTYRSTMFREAYENGGVFLMDEIDAGNANVLVLLNSALAGSQAAFPDHKMVRKHENFRFVSTANTFGTGASRQYVGRNQLDAATLDRFVTIDWPIDTVLEASTVAHLSHGPRWHKVVMAVRDVVTNAKMRVVVSPRATIKGAILLEAGISLENVIDMTLLATATEDQRPQIERAAKGAW